MAEAEQSATVVAPVKRCRECMRQNCTCQPQPAPSEALAACAEQPDTAEEEPALTLNVSFRVARQKKSSPAKSSLLTDAVAATSSRVHRLTRLVLR